MYSRFDQIQFKIWNVLSKKINARLKEQWPLKYDAIRPALIYFLWECNATLEIGKKKYASSHSFSVTMFFVVVIEKIRGGYCVYRSIESHFFTCSIFEYLSTGCSIFIECRQKWERSTFSFHHVSLFTFRWERILRVRTVFMRVFTF